MSGDRHLHLLSRDGFLAEIVEVKVEATAAGPTWTKQIHHWTLINCSGAAVKLTGDTGAPTNGTLPNGLTVEGIPKSATVQVSGAGGGYVLCVGWYGP